MSKPDNELDKLIAQCEDELLTQLVDQLEGIEGIAENTLLHSGPSADELERWEQALNKLDNMSVGESPTSAVSPPPLSGKPKKLKFLLAVAILAVLLAVTAGAVILTVFHFNMNGEVGSLTPTGSMVLPTPNVQGYQTLDDMLLDHGLPAMEPGWIPERFTLFELIPAGDASNGRQATLTARYSDAENGGRATFSILVTLYPQEVPRSLIANYEKENGYGRLELENGITCYLYENLELTGAVWEIEGQNCMYSITGPVSRADMKRIVESIPS